MPIKKIAYTSINIRQCIIWCMYGTRVYQQGTIMKIGIHAPDLSIFALLLFIFLKWEINNSLII